MGNWRYQLGKSKHNPFFRAKVRVSIYNSLFVDPFSFTISFFVDKLQDVLALAVALVVTLIPLPCTQLYRARKCVSAMRDAAGDLVKISQMGFGKWTCLLSYISPWVWCNDFCVWYQSLLQSYLVISIDVVGENQLGVKWQFSSRLWREKCLTFIFSGLLLSIASRF